MRLHEMWSVCASPCIPLHECCSLPFYAISVTLSSAASLTKVIEKWLLPDHGDRRAWRHWKRKRTGAAYVIVAVYEQTAFECCELLSKGQITRSKGPEKIHSYGKFCTINYDETQFKNNYQTKKCRYAGKIKQIQYQETCLREMHLRKPLYVWNTKTWSSWFESAETSLTQATLIDGIHHYSTRPPHRTTAQK